jgi:hypothetical protein
MLQGRRNEICMSRKGNVNGNEICMSRQSNVNGDGKA